MSITTSTKTSLSAVRLPDDLLRRVDHYAAQLESALHVSVSRSDAIRRLIVLGLEDAEDIHDAELALREPGGISLATARAEYGL